MSGPTLDDLHTAFVNAEAAGDSQAAQELFGQYHDKAGTSLTSLPKQAANSVVKGIAHTGDMLLNAPANALNLGKMAYGVASHELTGAIPPDVAAPNGTLYKAARSSGLSDMRNDPTSGVGKIADGAVQAAAGAMMGPGGLIKNAVSGLIGGAAGTTAELKGAGPAGTIAASLLAPSAAQGAVGLAKAFNRTALTQGGARNRVADNLLKDSGLSKPDMLLALENAKEIVPGSQPTTAQALMNPGLAGVEKAYTKVGGSLESGVGIPEAFSSRYTEQARAQGEAASTLMPVNKGADAAQRTIVGIAAQHKLQSEQESRASMNAIPSLTNLVADGASIKGIVGGNYANHKTATEQAYAGIDPHDTAKVPVPLKEMRDAANDIYKLSSLQGDNALPPEIVRLLDSAEMAATPHQNGLPSGQFGSAPASLSHINELRKLAGRIIQSAQTKPDGATLVGAATRLKEILSGVPQAAADAGLLPQSMSNAVSNAVSRRKSQGDIYETGPANKLNRDNADKAPVLEDAAVLPHFLNGSSESWQALKAASPSSPDRIQDIAANYLGDKFKRAVLSPDGTPKTAAAFSNAAADFKYAHRDILGDFPGLVSGIDSAVGVHQTLEQGASKLASGGLRHFLSGKDPDKAIKSWLGSSTREHDTRDIMAAIDQQPRLGPQPMGDVMAGKAPPPQLGPQLLGGLRDEMMGRVSKDGDAVLLQKKATELLDSKSADKLQPLLDKLLTPQHKGLLDGLVTDLQRTQFSKSANTVNRQTSDTQVANHIATRLAVNALNVSTKGGAGLVASLATRGKPEYSHSVTAQALLDPAYAAELLKTQKSTGAQYLKGAGRGLLWTTSPFQNQQPKE